MFKPLIKAPPLSGVAFGSTATLKLDKGLRYHAVRFIITCAKTIATASLADMTLSQIAGLINVKVNDVSKRQHTAIELNSIQTDWAANLAAKLHLSTGNDLLAAADTTGTINGISTATKRTYTWVLDVWFADPARKSYTAQQAFAWPTAWVKNGQLVQTADISFDITIPADPTVSGTVVYESLTIRAEVIADDVSGAFDGNQVRDNVSGVLRGDGNPIMPVTHYYRTNKDYSSTTPVIRDWPYSGMVQQISIFNPASDGVGAFIVKKNSKELFNTTKKSNNDSLRAYDWNTSRLDVTTGDSANNNQIQADLCHIACDFDDDPQSALPFAPGDILELSPTLIAAAASNKTLVLISQVWRDALRS